MSKLFISKVASALLLASALGAGSAQAAVITQYFVFSGASLGNTATATGSITFDPGSADQTFGISSPNDISVTVSGATAGNGTFDRSSFSDFVFYTGGIALDFSRELVGQSGWGTGFTGDFNLFGSGGSAPVGTGPFNLTTNNYSGDTMALTSMGPSGAVPEPETYALMGIGSLALAWARRRQQKKKDSPELQPAGFAAA